ncbi:MAG: hypothetical protein AAF734_09200 [Bacteroidota bacterium]
MKVSFKLFTLSLLFILLTNIDAEAQMSVAGKWKSTSGAYFYVVETDEGFKYQNMAGQQNRIWFFVKWQNDYDYNKYVAYKASNGAAMESYMTVKNDNGQRKISIFNAKSGKSNVWTRVGD